MRLSLNNLKHRQEYLDQLIMIKNKAVENAPPGTIKAKVRKGSDQYYYNTCKDGDEYRYLTVDRRTFAASVAQRQYDEKVIKAARREESHLKGLIKTYESGTAEDIYENLPPARRALVNPIMIPDNEFVKNWLTQPYEPLGFEEGASGFYAESGLRVRSKSEAAIANKYDALGIPMLYEKPVFLKGWGWVYPDFTLLSVRLRKEFIHEHLGKMDDPEYAKENVAKLNAYARNGYFPGKNLIITFETKDEPFNAKIIEDIAVQYLL